MHPDLQKYLDGELTRGELPPSLQAEADAWDELTHAARGMHAQRAPADLSARVLAALPVKQVRPSRWRAVLDAWLQPREIRVRPVYGALAAAALAAVLVVPRVGTNAGTTNADAPATSDASATPDEVGTSPASMVPGAEATLSGAAPIVYVRFTYPAPDARSVTLAGDFNDWQPGALALTDADGDGVWTGTFALTPGVHKYMFVIDEEHWETDPEAEEYIDDGFGNRNALIAIHPPAQRVM